MKRIFFAIMTLAVASLFMACGDQGANNKAVNTAAANTNASTPAPDPKAAEAEVTKVMEAVKDGLSKNDAEAMDKVYADNYMIVNADGSTMTKAERLAAIRSGDIKYTSFAYSVDNIRVSPDANSAVGIFKITTKGSFKGKPMDGDTRTTGVFAKTKDGWKLMSAANVKITAGPEPAKAGANTNMPANTKTAANTKIANAKIDSMAADEEAPPKKAANKK